jgi:hypothetical protein
MKENDIAIAIIINASDSLRKFEDELNTHLCDGLLPAQSVNFADAIKGKKLLRSMEDAVSNMLAASKIDAHQHAFRIAGMLNMLEAEGARHLFPDMRQIALTPMSADAFGAMIAQRKQAEEAEIEQFESCNPALPAL